MKMSVKTRFICIIRRDAIRGKEPKNLSWSVLLAVIFWGFSFIATKVALREVDPFTLVTLRFGIGALLLLIIQLHQRRRLFGVFSRRDWVYVVLLAAIGIAGHNLLQAHGLLYTTAINAGWIIAIQPIFIMIAARLFLGEAITVRKMTGIVLGFSGIFLVISKGVFSLSTFHYVSTFGDLLVLISTMTWSAFTVGGRGFLSRFSPLAAITPIMIVGWVITFLLCSQRGEWSRLFHLSLSVWAGILFLGIFCSGLAYFFWYSALEKRDSSTVGMHLYLIPLVTLTGSFFLLSEEIKLTTLTGGGMILAGVYLATRRISRHLRTKNLDMPVN